MSRTLTPLCDFVRAYAESDAHRLHMPGHKGASVLGCEAFDITEIDGADVLYHPHGILAQSQNIARDLFGAKKTLYSAEGSSLSIRAMLYLAQLDAKQNGRSQTVLAARNAHKVFLSAAALLDFPVVWLYGEENSGLLSCRITPAALEDILSSTDTPPAAVYITSPDYLGYTADITALARVCHAHGTLLLVDNAHGAYLHFLENPIHPLDLGADLCCDSAHKTLPVLTGGGYLHLSHRVSDMLCDQAEAAMALFASTSPSYLILQSLDAANACLGGDYRAELSRLCTRMQALTAALTDHGYDLCGDEVCKLTIVPKSFGYTGEELAGILTRYKLIPEFYDPDYVVLMVTPQTSDETLDHLEQTLTAIPRRTPMLDAPPPLPSLRTVCTPRNAMLSPSETVPVEDCIGRVLAQPSVSCPPAIPIAVSGEELTEDAVRAFRYWGIETCSVIAKT
ncbi:MAG: PLP-dependent transferase [Clostridia bacterium]|nr:PLP-dependent transferase [Clostridia bacterium]